MTGYACALRWLLRWVVSVHGVGLVVHGRLQASYPCNGVWAALSSILRHRPSCFSVLLTRTSLPAAPTLSSPFSVYDGAKRTITGGSGAEEEEGEDSLTVQLCAGGLAGGAAAGAILCDPRISLTLGVRMSHLGDMQSSALGALS